MRKLSLLLFAYLVVFTACEKDEDDASVPTVTYAETTLNAEFYTEGNSATPSLQWNGNQGSLSFSQSITGLSINPSTGQISWTKLLPPGTHNVEVMAKNSAGEIMIPITIENTLKGTFSGTFTENGISDSYAIEFANDGTNATIFSLDTTASGPWYWLGNEILVDYTYNAGNNPDYSVKLSLNQTSSSATMSGNWYFEHGAAEINFGGLIDITYEN